MSVRSQILANLAARLAPLAANCASWKASPWRTTDLPAISWRDGVQREERQLHGGPACYRLRIALAGYLTGTVPTSVARTLLADMLAAVGTDPRCGGLATRTEWQRMELKAEQSGDAVAACLLIIDIIYDSVVDETVPADNTLTSDGELLTSDGEALTW